MEFVSRLHVAVKGQRILSSELGGYLGSHSRILRKEDLHFDKVARALPDLELHSLQLLVLRSQ